MANQEDQERSVDVQFIAKTLFQLQTSIAQLALALLEKAREEGVTHLPIPPMPAGFEGKGSDRPTPEPIVDATCDDMPSEGDSGGLVDATCDDMPSEGDSGGLVDATCDDEPGTDNECEDAAEMLCRRIPKITRYLQLLCQVLRYRRPV